MATEVTKPTAGLPQRPADLFTAMRDEMDRVFERFETGFPRFPGMFARRNGREWLLPELDIHDNGQQLIIEVDLPGVDQKDVSVTIANGILTIKGEKKSEHEETKDNCYVAERSYGAFERSLQMPDSIDETKVDAKFDKGVLKIVAAKRADALKAERKIHIKNG